MGKAAAIPAEAQPGEVGRNPFATPAYRSWWAASVAAGLGVGVQLVTVPLFVRDRVDPDDRALALAGALIAETLPGAFLVLFGGVVADRFERRGILVRAYAIAALVSLSFVFLSAGDVGAIWPVFPLAAVVGAVGAFTQPTRQSMVPRMLARPQVQNGVILGTMGFFAALQVGGPFAAGHVADEIGLTTAFMCEVLFLAGAVFLFWSLPKQPPQGEHGSVRADLREGIGYVRRSGTLLGLLFLAFLPGLFFVGPFGVTAIIMVNDVLEESDRYLGILTACFGLGVVAGSLLLTFVRLPSRGAVLCATPVAAGLTFVAFGASERVELSMAILVAWGGCAAVFINLAIALLQETADDARMGRVMSMYALGAAASAPLGYAQAGLVANFWGPQAAIISSGLAVAVIGILCLLFLGPVRRLR
jgi:MFS family permease